MTKDTANLPTDSRDITLTEVFMKRPMEAYLAISTFYIPAITQYAAIPPISAQERNAIICKTCCAKVAKTKATVLGAKITHARNLPKSK